MSTLTVDPIRSLVWRTLLFEGGGWTGRGLADYVNRPWATIRRKVRDLEAVGLVERRDGRLYLSECGEEMCDKLHQETMKIALGQQVGYSRELQAFGVKISPLRREASTISFPSIDSLAVSRRGSK